jgi:hypothetical protein
MLSFFSICHGTENLKKLEEFHNSQPQVSIFQSQSFHGIYALSKNHDPFCYFVTEDEKIKGCLNGVILRNYFWPLSNLTSRAVIIGGPQVLNNDIKVLDILLENYDKTIKRKLIYTQFRNLRKFSDDEKAVFEKHGYKYEEHLDIIHDLRIPVNEQWMKIHGGRRKNIRRAEKNGLVFREILNESEFWKAYDLVTKTYDRVKLPMPDKSLFREIFLQMGGTGSFKTFVALNTIEIIATRMVFCYKDLIYDWYAGASDKHSDKYPNDFLPWKVIEWGSQNGYKFFDFGGAGKPDVPYGVRDHKLKFGGELVEFGRFEKIHKPVLMKFGILGLKLIKSGQNGLRK